MLKRHIFLAKLAGFSTVVHVVFLIFFFVLLHRDEVISFRFQSTFSPNAAEVVLLPLIKSVNEKASVVNAQRTVSPAVVTAVSAPVQSRQTVAKSAVTPKSKLPANPKKTPVLAKPSEPKKPVVAQPPKPLPIQKPESVHQEPVQSVEKKQKQEQSIVHLGRDDAYALQLHEKVYQALLDEWTPPPNVPHDARCSIRARVNAVGKVQDIEIIEPSGAVVYDIAAREAVLRALLPRSVWAKTIVVTFDQ